MVKRGPSSARPACVSQILIFIGSMQIALGLFLFDSVSAPGRDPRCDICSEYPCFAVSFFHALAPPSFPPNRLLMSLEASCFS